MVEYKIYQPEFAELQVDLIWNITDQWKYEYQTSYDTVKNAYKGENFDPKSRIYAFDGDKLVGFVGVNISKDKEGNLVGNMRLPLTINSDEEINNELMDRIESYLREKGVVTVLAPAGVGLGDTTQVAENLGFSQKNEMFKRTYARVADLKVSGNTDGVYLYDDEKHKETVKDIFMAKMGMPAAQGEGFFGWAHSNSQRKNSVRPKSASWQLYNDKDGLNGYSYLMKSDHNPKKAHSMPIWFQRNVEEVIDRLLSAHLAYLEGIELIGNYLIPGQYSLEEVYNKFGFEYDPSYRYEKTLR